MVDVDNKNEWRECFDVGGVKLPTGLYFGASAATGQLAGINFTAWMKISLKLRCENITLFVNQYISYIIAIILSLTKGKTKLLLGLLRNVLLR